MLPLLCRNVFTKDPFSSTLCSSQLNCSPRLFTSKSNFSFTPPGVFPAKGLPFLAAILAGFVAGVSGAYLASDTQGLSHPYTPRGIPQSIDAFPREADEVYDDDDLTI